ncbi:DUF2243 domain-containing protein [Lysinibacillus sp. SGAir0095]|uniref:DUF2243 domain-containing protein n=1 Tax=Lysinibacillus sp. SGAir0095 TaxID=2070463 RepID=UPI0010CD00A5|nr:DUF2243 domain-containing protein [Lysinibacillus sp. SGAir0095]QCR33938.1 DUF2243 domain-containing protein [Lysinibacillus sp. SGAir0095]
MEKRKNSQDEPFNFWSGVLFGLGLVAFIDEAVFHQLLHWHHFYDKSTTSIGLISDGLFHAFSWFATVVGLFMLADIRKRKVWNIKRWVGAAILGAGLFQLYDGIIQHKLMRLHQIRYDVEVIYYDIVWNVIACCMIVVGLILLMQKKSPELKKNAEKHHA